jgi:hypothetical protein
MERTDWSRALTDADIAHDADSPATKPADWEDAALKYQIDERDFPYTVISPARSAAFRSFAVFAGRRRIHRPAKTNCEPRTAKSKPLSTRRTRRHREHGESQNQIPAFLRAFRALRG